MKTTVVRARQPGVRGYVNVCRPTMWGNPFPVNVYGRDGALERYRQHLVQRAACPIIRDALRELKGKRLGCVCSQEEIDAGRCHAVILARFVDELFPDTDQTGVTP